MTLGSARAHEIYAEGAVPETMQIVENGAETPLGDMVRGKMYLGMTKEYAFYPCPKCGAFLMIRFDTPNGHTLEVHEDGSPTITGSLLHVKMELSLCDAHFFVKRGQIEWC